MMFVVTPDRDKGRCRNLRPDDGLPGSYLRCLRREDEVGHACVFDPPTKRATFGGVAYQQPEPREWVPITPCPKCGSTVRGHNASHQCQGLACKQTTNGFSFCAECAEDQ